MLTFSSVKHQPFPCQHFLWLPFQLLSFPLSYYLALDPHPQERFPFVNPKFDQIIRRKPYVFFDPWQENPSFAPFRFFFPSSCSSQK